MRQQSYLIDTNILIGLEDHRAIEATYAKFSNLAASHKIDVFVHEAARDDILRDKDAVRRRVSLSKIQKYQILSGRKGLSPEELERTFGPLRKPNDIVDATLLHALVTGVVDFLVTQDKGLHDRASKYGADLGRRVLFVGDAADLITQTYEPIKVPVRHVEEAGAHTIDPESQFFNSLREDYPEFDNWWQAKCVRLRRPCWVVYDNDDLAGLIVRKDESANDTDAVTKAQKVLKICTFKVAPEKRGVKLGELLLKQVLWYAQTNGYNLAYLTTYEEQQALMNLLEFYGFKLAGTRDNGELIYERIFSSSQVDQNNSEIPYDFARKNYPRFLVSESTKGFGVPITEEFHDVLYPDIWHPRQSDLFRGPFPVGRPTKPGNTIRKVYICRSPSNLGPAGSLLLFYKGKSRDMPSQSVTSLGVLEGVALATSTRELMQLAGGRSVYSENQLNQFEATPDRPVKVINYLHVSYINPAVGLEELNELGVLHGAPPQSIFEIGRSSLLALLERSNLKLDVH